MPAEQGGWLHNDEGLSPVEPTAEPRQGETGGIGRTPRRDVALLIERELLAEKEIFRRERRREVQTEAQELQAIAQQRPERANDLEQVEPARASCHCQCAPL